MWTTLGNPGEVAIDLEAAMNSDGHLEVFVVTTAGSVWHNWQVAPGGDWAGWTQMAAPGGSGVGLSVGQNAATRLEVFTILADGSVWHAWQVTPNGDWSAWQSMGNPQGAATLVVARNADGRLELVLASSGADGSVWHSAQTAPNAGWSDWAMLGSPLTTPLRTLAWARTRTVGWRCLAQPRVVASGTSGRRRRTTTGPAGLCLGPRMRAASTWR